MLALKLCTFTGGLGPSSERLQMDAIVSLQGAFMVRQLPVSLGHSFQPPIL